MLEENKEVNIPEETSPLEDVIASSPEAQEATEEEVQETETSTPQQDVTPEEETPTEEERIPYSRFKEKVDESNWYKERMQELMNKPAPQPIQQPQAQPNDPYANATAEERQFLQQRDDRARQIAKEEYSKNIQPQLDAAKQEFARIQYQDFRRAHPEVKANSPKEMEIIQKMQQYKIPLDEAYKLATYGDKVDASVVKSEVKSKQRLAAKRQANATSPQSNSPASAPQKGSSFDDEFARNMDNDWNGEI